MQIAYYRRISPKQGFWSTFTVQVKNQQSVFWNGLYNIFTQTPRLHGPSTMRIEITEKMMNSFSYGFQIFRSIYRRSTFVERIGSINSVCTKQSGLFFKESTSHTGKQRISRVQLGSSFETTPGALLVNIRCGILLFQLTRYVTGEALLNRLHSQLQLPWNNFFTQCGMFINHSFRKGSTITLKVLHPLPSCMSGTSQESTRFFISEIETQQGVIPHSIQPNSKKRHIDGVHRHKVKFPLPTFPIPPGSSIAHSTIVHVHTITAVDETALLCKRLRQFFRKLELITKPGNMRLTSILQIPVKGSSQRNGRVTSKNHLFAVAVYLVDIRTIIGSYQLQPVLRRVTGSYPLYQIINGFDTLVLTRNR